MADEPNMKRAKQTAPVPRELDYRLYRPALHGFHSRRLEKLVFDAEVYSSSPPPPASEDGAVAEQHPGLLGTTADIAGEPGIGKDEVADLYPKSRGPALLTGIFVALEVACFLWVLIFVISGDPRRRWEFDEERDDPPA